MTFYFCDSEKSTCIFTERSMQSLWKKTGGDICRCIRHGQIITTRRDFPDKEQARKWSLAGADPRDQPL